MPVVLDMSYKSAFPGTYVAFAYERMFLKTFKGDGSLFVGSEELVEAWRIFTARIEQCARSGVMSRRSYSRGSPTSQRRRCWSCSSSA